MGIELACLVGALVLGFVQIIAFDVARTSQYGLKWNVGPRDADMPPLKPLAGRLKRAQDNLFETLPLFMGFVLAAKLSGQTGALTALGAQLYLAMRVVYIPLYAFGVTGLRSLVWVASMGGIALVGWPSIASLI